MLRAIEFPRIRGEKPLDVGARWFVGLLADIGQPVGAETAARR